MTSEEYKTMRVTVFVKIRPLHIFNSFQEHTHNFLDVYMAKKLGCKMEEVGPIRVDVANGNNLACVVTCKGLSWNL